MITENVSTLKIHKLSQTQYDRALAAGNIAENEIYLTPDDDAVITIEDIDAICGSTIETGVNIILNDCSVIDDGNGNIEIINEGA